MLELRIKTGRRTMPIFDLPAAVGRDQAAREVGDTIEGLLAFLDDLGGDPDLETTGAEDDFMEHPLVCGVWEHGPGCPVADTDCGAEEGGEMSGYAEWHTLSAVRRRAGHIDGKSIREGRAIGEDAEDDDQDTSVEDGPEGFDPEEDCCTAGDDRVMSGAGIGYTAVNDHLGPGSEDDAEREQMPHDVPALPVYSLELNPFTGTRVSLGRSNLMTSFRTNCQPTRSADTVKGYKSKGWAQLPGQPV